MSEYALRFSNYYEHIIWFNAISFENIREEIFKFTVAHRLISETETDTKLIYKEFKSWLKNERDWLLMFDNVENYDNIYELIDLGSLPKTGKHKNILIIFRLNSNEFTNITSISVNMFTMKEARTFFYLYTKKNPDEYTDKIAQKQGNLPLALEQNKLPLISKNKENRIKTILSSCKKNLWSSWINYLGLAYYGLK